MKFGQQVWSVSQSERATREPLRFAENGPKMGVFGENDPQNYFGCEFAPQKALPCMEPRCLSH